MKTAHKGQGKAIMDLMTKTFEQVMLVMIHLKTVTIALALQGTLE